MIFASKVNFNSPVYNPQMGGASAARNSFHPVTLAAFTTKGSGMPGESQIKKILRLSGIYQIRCDTNGKIYIGSAVNIPARWTTHRRSLRRNVHRNRYLQHDWNNYGEESFEFNVLEYVKPAFLLRAEQEWIDKSQCTDRKIGFNIYPIAGSPGKANAQLWEGFISPGGNEISIFNLQEFCRQQGLDFSSMHRLARGKSKLKSYKGWTHKNIIRQRDYVKTYDGFIDPDGHHVGPITNLAAFVVREGWATRIWWPWRMAGFVVIAVGHIRTADENQSLRSIQDSSVLTDNEWLSLIYWRFAVSADCILSICIR